MVGLHFPLCLCACSRICPYIFIFEICISAVLYCSFIANSYQLAFNTNRLNVVASLFVAILALRLLSKIRSGILATMLIAMICVFLEVFPFEYGAYGLLLVLIFKYAKSHELFIMHLLLNLIYMFSYGWVIQFVSIIPTLVIVYGPGIWSRLETRSLPSWIWRAFYPVHLVILMIVGYFIGK